MPVLVSEPGDGLYDAMNKGIEKASGDVITLLLKFHQAINPLIPPSTGAEQLM